VISWPLAGAYPPALAASSTTTELRPTLIRAEQADTMMEVSIWLNPRNEDQLDALAHELYDPTSPNYRHWLKSTDIATWFAPSAAEVQTV
jgi:subtilase family serine protease